MLDNDSEEYRLCFPGNHEFTCGHFICRYCIEENERNRLCPLCGHGHPIAEEVVPMPYSELLRRLDR